MKAIVLVSGGLDSILAAKLVQRQGIEIIPLNFRIPFCGLEKSQRMLDLAQENLGAKPEIINLADDLLEIIKNPRYGYGSNMNPCIDCRILMLKKTGELFNDWGAKFAVTGEVLGQRSMSQHKSALAVVEKRAGLEGLVLRPLSAKLLSPTIPEREGWVNREGLMDFNGRSRKPQIALAGKFNIKQYPNPAGGCLLTDPEFAKRLKDILGSGELNLKNIELLKIGRHFRISENTKLIVGRNQKENERLSSLAEGSDYLFKTIDVAGPVGLARGVFDEGLITLCARIICRYCDLGGDPGASILSVNPGGKAERVLNVLPLAQGELERFRV